MRLSRLFPAALAFIFFSLPLHAETGICAGSALDLTRLAPAHITGPEKRVYFFRDNITDPSCPADKEECRLSAYMIPGDAVIAERSEKDFTCVLYMLGTREMQGWVKSASVKAEEEKQPKNLNPWIGRWRRIEADIRITPSNKPGLLIIDGNATYGALDSGRVARGGVNMGEIGGEAAPEKNILSFTMGNEATLPYDKGEESDCRVQMRLLGPLLFVRDNGNCGGMNVRFDGTYRHGKP